MIIILSFSEWHHCKISEHIDEKKAVVETLQGLGHNSLLKVWPMIERIIVTVIIMLVMN